MKIEITVIGTFCNTWPDLVLEINKQKVFETTVEGKQSYILEHNDLKPTSNSLVIGMQNKLFGKNKVWDTKTVDNKIVEDKTIRIVSLKLDDVECKDLFRNRFQVQRVDKQPSYFPEVVDSIDTMNYNGYFAFDFDLPLYNSLIMKKHKSQDTNEVSYFSNYTKVFHYEGEQRIINDIKQQLKEIDEKFSDQRSKARNS